MNLTPLLVDAVLLVCILLCAFFGYRRGALATLISLMGAVAALFAALLLTPSISSFLSDTWVEPALTAPIEEALKNAAEENGTLAAALAAPPEALASLLKVFDITLAPELLAEGNVTAVAATLAAPLAAALSYAVTFPVLLILLLCLVRLLLVLAKKFNRVPLLGGANRIIGLLLGLCEGILLAWALAETFHQLLPYLAAEKDALFYGFDESAPLLYRTLNSFNPIALLSDAFSGQTIL